MILICPCIPTVSILFNKLIGWLLLYPPELSHLPVCAGGWWTDGTVSGFDPGAVVILVPSLKSESKVAYKVGFPKALHTLKKPLFHTICSNLE